MTHEEWIGTVRCLTCDWTGHLEPGRELPCPRCGGLYARYRHPIELRPR